MTANNPLKPSGGGGKPSPKQEHPQTDVIGVASQEVEESLKELAASIDSVLEEPALRTSVPSSDMEDKQKQPHFTLASSQTKRD